MTLQEALGIQFLAGAIVFIIAMLAAFAEFKRFEYRPLVFLAGMVAQVLVVLVAIALRSLG